MDPLGTITLDFPLLSNDTRQFLETLLIKSSDYFDFTDCLSKIASESNTDPEIVFFAVLHSWHSYYKIGLHRLEKAHPENVLTKPFILTETEPILAAVEEALNINPSDAIRFYLLMRVLRISEIGTREEAWAQEEIEKLLKKNKQLRGHSAFYFYQLGRHLRYEGDPEGGYELYRKALELAKEADDRRLQVNILFMMAEIAAFFRDDSESRQESEEQIFEAKRIAEEINFKAGLGSVLNHLSIRAIHRGELQEAIDCQLEGMRMVESLGDESVAGARNLVGMYAGLGDGNTALEWAKYVYERWSDSVGLAPYADMAMMTAYLALDKLDKAREHLDRAKEHVFKSGYEMALGAWYAASGSLEMKTGDLESAMDSFLKALEINKRANRHMRVNGCISRLVDIEIKMFNPTKENRDAELSGPWMERAAQVAEKKDAPAVHAQMMLWKAELRMKQGRHEEAFDLIDSAIDQTDTPESKVLQERAIKMREGLVEEGLIAPRPPNKKGRR